MKVLFELMKCIKDQLTRAKHASRSAAEASNDKFKGGTPILWGEPFQGLPKDAYLLNIF